MYIIVCLDDGQYRLTTKQYFENEQDAEEYKNTIAESRNPIIVRISYAEFFEDKRTKQRGILFRAHETGRRNRL